MKLKKTHRGKTRWLQLDYEACTSQEVDLIIMHLKPYSIKKIKLKYHNHNALLVKFYLKKQANILEALYYTLIKYYYDKKNTLIPLSIKIRHSMIKRIDLTKNAQI